MQITNEMLADRCGLLTGQVEPVQNRIRCTLLHPADRAQATAFDQHGHHIQQQRATASHSCKESAFVKNEGLSTGNAVKPAFSIVVDFDVVRVALSKVGTSFVIAPLVLGFHCTSPLSLLDASMLSLKQPFPP